jgi:glycosyltransferase involved in cell wall biosynthesis
MKIGIILSDIGLTQESLLHQFGSTIELLQQEHELIYAPRDYLFRSEARAKDVLKDMLLSCDILLGWAYDLVLQVRQDINKQIPYICFMLGTLPRGIDGIMKYYHLFRTTDVLLVNCTSDIEIANHFFENAQVRLLPMPIKESDFYPLDDASKQAFRATLGFNSEDRILLYSGRITLEKNVHSILRIFSVIQKLIPNTRLIIAGRPDNNPSFLFGSYSININHILEKITTKLGIDQDKVRFIGHQEKTDLCGLYNIADAVINMTLNADENFGLSQVEAMACGAPVIGTNWGGLKDTIEDGETGYKVSTMLTASGIKLNWWEAVNKVVSFLRNDSERLQLRQKCVNIAHNKYSLSRYCEDLRSIIVEAQGKADGVSVPLKASEFAQRYWNSLTNITPSYQLYKELIPPYTGTSQEGAAVDQRLKANQVVCLSTPLIEVGEGSFEINDPIFPFSITIPVEHKKVARIVIEAMMEEPAIVLERLTNKYLAGQANISDALEWMIDAGLIFYGGIENEALSASCIGGQMSLPLFSFQSVNSLSDIVVLREVS